MKDTIVQLLFDDGQLGENFKVVRIWKPTATYYANVAFQYQLTLEETINRILIVDIEQKEKNLTTFPLRFGNDGLQLRDRVMMWKKKRQEAAKTPSI